MPNSLSLSDYVIASVTHPYFKLRWVPQSLVGSVRDLFLAKAVADLETVPSSAAVDVHRVADSDEFFSFESDETSFHP